MHNSILNREPYTKPQKVKLIITKTPLGFGKPSEQSKIMYYDLVKDQVLTELKKYSRDTDYIHKKIKQLDPDEPHIILETPIARINIRDNLHKINASLITDTHKITWKTEERG